MPKDEFSERRRQLRRTHPIMDWETEPDWEHRVGLKKIVSESRPKGERHEVHRSVADRGGDGSGASALAWHATHHGKKSPAHTLTPRPTQTLSPGPRSDEIEPVDQAAIGERLPNVAQARVLAPNPWDHSVTWRHWFSITDLMKGALAVAVIGWCAYQFSLLFIAESDAPPREYVYGTFLAGAAMYAVGQYVMRLSRDIRNRRRYWAYINSTEWQGARAKALEYAQGRCQICFSTVGLQVHHRTYRRVSTELPADLTVLCSRCHALFHQGGNMPDDQYWKA